MIRKTACLLFLTVILCTGCKRVLNREEAERSLKVLNSNLVNFISLSSEKPEIQGLYFLLDEPASPLTLTQNRNFFKRGTSSDSPAKLKGIYQWYPGKKLFEKKDTSKQLVLLFPLEEKPGDSARFVLSEFESQDCKSRPEFPVTIKADMFINGLKKLTIDHQAEVQDNLPLHVSGLVAGDGYKLIYHLNRTRQEESGTIDLDLILKANGFELCSFGANAKIGYSRQGYYFRYISFQLKIFEHEITGELDYSKIDPTASDYIDLFNRYSRIGIRETAGPEVGNIILGETGNGELLDYFVKFANGDKVLLSSYIPMLKKILNYKY